MCRMQGVSDLRGFNGEKRNYGKFELGFMCRISGL
jgi:hypothetical protein